MAENFAPQLALFVAGRAELALYREFVFPSVPARTGLLPTGLDDIRAGLSQSSPMANDITLRKAAVVVYDRSFGSRLPLDYVLTIRGVGPVVIVEAPPARAQLDRPPGNDMQLVIRPADMSLWPEGFVEPLISRISALSLRPSSHEVGEHLRCLTEQDKYADLLLTCLALLEHDLRREDLPTAVPSSPTGGVMARLRDHFDADYQVVIDAVGLRHELLQHRLAEGHSPDASQEAVQSVPQDHLNHTSSALADVVRRRYGIP